MNTQRLIELLDSDAFLTVSYSIIFIMLSFYAIKFLAKLLMFVIYVFLFMFAMSFMFSTTGNNSIDFDIAKIYKNAKGYIAEISDMAKDSKNLFDKLYKSAKDSDFSEITNDAQKKLNNLANDGKKVLDSLSDKLQSSTNNGKNKNESSDIFIEIK